MFLASSCCDYASAFVGVLTVLGACCVGVRAIPFGAAAWACSFIFIAPDFQFGAADVTVNV